MPPMKILLIGNYYFPEHVGGVEVVSFNLVKCYREKGNDVRWMAADVPPRLRSARAGDVPVRASNITEERLGFPHPIPYPEVLVKLYKSLRWCEAVHLQDCLYSINMLAFLMAKLLQKPVLITQYAKFIPYRQAYKRWLQSLAFMTVTRWMFKTAGRVVFITSNVRDAMRYVNPTAEYEVVPLGVDTKFFRPISSRRRALVRNQICRDPLKPMILFVGRMVERKGIDLVRLLVERHPEWHWVLVGRPDDQNPGAWHLPNMTYWPRLGDHELGEVFASADVLLHPSRGEGITLTVSECMAAGTPVVIARESLEELVPGDRHVFHPVDLNVASIEEAIHGLISMNSEGVQSLRNACRRFAEKRWSWGGVSDRYLSMLRELAHPAVVET